MTRLGVLIGSNAISVGIAVRSSVDVHPRQSGKSRSAKKGAKSSDILRTRTTPRPHKHNGPVPIRHASHPALARFSPHVTRLHAAFWLLACNSHTLSPIQAGLPWGPTMSETRNLSRCPPAVPRETHNDAAY